jgi:hypothetical protein
MLHRCCSRMGADTAQPRLKVSMDSNGRMQLHHHYDIL